MAYATGDDLAARKDVNTIRDLATDDEAPVDLSNINTNANIVAALADASGEVDSALLVGGVYTTDDLASLTANSLAKLKRITCEIAMAFLFARRPKYDEDGYDKALERADKWLERLRKGERVFEVTDEDPAAGTLPTIDGPTVVTYDRLRLMVDRTKNFYPHRGQRLPEGRGGN